MVEEIHARNADLPEDELEDLVEEAVRWSRSGRSG